MPPSSELNATVPDRLAAALPDGVERRETHASWVLLAGETAWKVRKPVRFAFLDYGTLERRYAASAEEVRVNAALAPGVYRGVRALRSVGGRLEPAGWGWDEQAEEYAVEMRRFDERRTLAALSERGPLDAGALDAVGAALARFHAAARACDGDGAAAGGGGGARDDGAAAFFARVAADLDDLAGAGLAAAVPELRRYAAAARTRRAAALDARAAAGLRRDGHGDVRAEHVVCEPGTPLVVDRIEFDPSLRCADVASDLAFLTMDLEALGQPAAAARVADAYAAAGGCVGGPSERWLLALFGWQRALVRAKVARLRGDGAAAERRLALAAQLAWRERLPPALLVAGPPASGKSTLAAALAQASGRAVIASDVERKRLLGVAPTERLGDDGYRPEVTARVYRALGEAAAAARDDAGGVGAVVDATARSAELRAELAAGLGDALGPLTVVLCAAPDAVRRERARARLADPQRVSDADAAVAAALGAAFERPDAREPGVGRVVAVDATAPLAGQLAAVAAALDGEPAAAAGGQSPTTGSSIEPT